MFGKTKRATTLSSSLKKPGTGVPPSHQSATATLASAARALRSKSAVSSVACGTSPQRSTMASSGSSAGSARTSAGGSLSQRSTRPSSLATSQSSLFAAAPAQSSALSTASSSCGAPSTTSGRSGAASSSAGAAAKSHDQDQPQSRVPVPSAGSASASKSALGKTVAPSSSSVKSCSSASSLSAPKAASSSLTRSSSSASARQVPTFAMSFRDKDQQIRLLIKERDEQRQRADLMTRKCDEWRDRFEQSELEKSNVTSEADDEVVELKRLAQEFEDENRRLLVQMNEKSSALDETQFKLDELECATNELRRKLDDSKREYAELLEDRREAHAASQAHSERAKSKVKYERQIEELERVVQQRDEHIIQLRTSLDKHKHEASNLKQRATDLEQAHRLECERGERQLKRIDEINLELKAAEQRYATKCQENELNESQARQARQELRLAEERFEQAELARKRELGVNSPQAAASGRAMGAGTPVGGGAPAASSTPSATPTPQDECVRLQLECRELRELLIDREAELDCQRRDMDLMRRKMETRTLEVDCNNQELARRCQDLLEQNRQSEDTVKQLLGSVSEHSVKLMRATDDLREANGKCVELRGELQELERLHKSELEASSSLQEQCDALRAQKLELERLVDELRKQVDELQAKVRDMCEQLDSQTQLLHRDRELLAEQLNRQELDTTQMQRDLCTARQDLRSARLQAQEHSQAGELLRNELQVKEKFVASRNNIIETLRHELSDVKARLEQSRHAGDQSSEQERDARAKLDELAKRLAERQAECDAMRAQLDEQRAKSARDEDDWLAKFDAMRHKHSAQVDELHAQLGALRAQLQQLEQERAAGGRPRTVADDKAERAIASDRVGVGAPAAHQAGRQFGGAQQRVECLSPASTVSVGDYCTPADDGDGGAASQRDDGSNLALAGGGARHAINGKPAANKDKPLKSALKSRPATNGAGKLEYGPPTDNKDDFMDEIEFLNSVVCDLQRTCDDYRNHWETLSVFGAGELAEPPGMASKSALKIRFQDDEQVDYGASSAGHGNKNSNYARSQTLHHHRPKQAVAGCVGAPQPFETMTLARHSNRQRREQQHQQQQIHACSPLDELLLVATGHVDGANGTTSSGPDHEFNQQLEELKSRTRLSGRPYCDICCVHDLHHTIYCTKLSEKLRAKRPAGTANSNVNSNSTTNNIINNNTPYTSNNNINNTTTTSASNKHNNNNVGDMDEHEADILYSKARSHAAAAAASSSSELTTTTTTMTTTTLAASVVDEMFRDYEQSTMELGQQYQQLSSSTVAVSDGAIDNMSTLSGVSGRAVHCPGGQPPLAPAPPPPPRPYCDHCDSFGHIIKNCLVLRS